MPTQGERQEYLWKPNDESATTRGRYDLEANHFYRSFKSAQLKDASNSNSIGVIGLILSLSLNIILLIVVSIIDLIRHIRGN